MAFDTSWLINKLSVEELQQKHLTKIKFEEKDLSLPFGYLYGEWLQLKSMLEPGDEIWEFQSPSEYWESLCGSAGVVLLRKGLVIFSIETEFN